MANLQTYSDDLDRVAGEAIRAHLRDAQSLCDEHFPQDRTGRIVSMSVGAIQCVLSLGSDRAVEHLKDAIGGFLANTGPIIDELRGKQEAGEDERAD